MCSDAAIQISHVTSSRPSTFEKPSPAPGSAPEDERSQRRGQQAHHLDQQEEPERSEHRGRGGYLGRPMSLYDLVAALPLQIEGYTLEGLARTVSSGFERKSTVFALQGAGEEGRGEDVTYEARAHDAQQAAGPVLELAGEWTFDSFSEHLGDARHCSRATRPSRPSTAATGAGASSRRRWTSRCARRARRCTSCSAARPSRSRSSSPRGWATPPTIDPGHAPARASTPRCASSSTRTPDWTEELIGELQETGAVDSIDFKGAYKGTVVDVETDPAFYQHIAEAFPDAWLEDPDLETDEARNALAAHQDRITWDAPIHSRRRTSSTRR